MHRLVRFGLVSFVLVALLSTGTHALVEGDSFEPEAADCGYAELYVSPDEDASPEDVDVAYEDLPERERRAIDESRFSEHNSASVDPAVVDDLPTSVTIDDTVYRVSDFVRNCPLVTGMPRWTNTVLIPLWGIYEVFSPLYLPGVAVLTLGIAYRYVDDWLRFD